MSIDGPVQDKSDMDDGQSVIESELRKTTVIDND